MISASIEELRRRVKGEPEDRAALEALARCHLRLGDRVAAYRSLTDSELGRSLPLTAELGAELAQDEDVLLRNKRIHGVRFAIERKKRGGWDWLKPAKARAKRRPILSVLVEGNATKTLLKRLAPLSLLQELRFRHKVTEAALALIPLPALRGLRLLSLHGSQLTAPLLGAVARLPSLRCLEVDRCELVAPEALGQLAALTQLTEISLICSDIDERGLAALAACPALRRLDLFGCEGVGDRALSTLGGFDRLQDLGLSSCHKISDAGASALGGLSALRKLGLNNAKISDAGLEALATLTELEELSLAGCRSLTNAGMKALARLPRLKRLHLDHMQGLNGRGLAHLAKCPALSWLSLRGCDKVSARGLARLSFLSNYAELFERISRLELTATVPDLSYPQFAELACRMRFFLDEGYRGSFCEPESWRTLSACMYALTEGAETEDWHLSRSEACFGPAEIGREIGWSAKARGLAQDTSFQLSSEERYMGGWEAPKLRLLITASPSRHKALRAAWKREIARLKSNTQRTGKQNR